MNPRWSLIDAEIAAWPLISPIALDKASTRTPDGRTDQVDLAGLAGRLAGFGAHSHIERRVLAAWPEPIDILDHLNAVAKANLRREGDRVVLRDAGTTLRWRDMSLCVPPGLLVVALDPHAALGHPTVDVLHPTVAPTCPVAHLHQHAEATPPFEVVWANVATRFEPKGARKSAPADLATNWCALLGAALCGRRWLANRWLNVPWTDDTDGGWLRFLLRPRVAPPEPSDVKAWARVAVRPPELQKSLVRPPARHASPEPETVAKVFREEPLGWLDASWPDGAWLAEGFRRKADGRLDCSANEYPVFLQVLRAKCLLFRHLLADTRFQGLVPFTSVYRRIFPYTEGLDQCALELASLHRGISVGAVEMRRAPPKSVEELRSLVATSSARDPAPDSTADGPEWGWTFHFIRDQERWAPARSNGNPADEVRGDPARWLTRALQAVEKQVQGLETALSESPELLHVVRGIDVASDELAGPMWVMAPGVRRLRKFSEDLASRHAGLFPMRVTLHAGEDFAHPMTGLRHVHELLIWGLLRPQDRVGHAVSLGVDLARFEGARVLQPRFERFLDLSWLLSAIEEPWTGGPHRDVLSLLPCLPQTYQIRDARVEELERLATGLGMQRRPLAALIAVHRELGAPDRLATTWGVGRRPDGDDALDDFLRAMVTQEAHQVVEVNVESDELDELESRQCAIIQELKRAVITIELNPTSNMIVAGLGGMLDQPLFANLTERGLAVTVSADDPLLLSTCLDDEIAYAHAGLMRAGRTPAEARAWIEAAAAASMRARFTLPSSRDLSSIPPPGPPGEWHWRRS